MACHYHAEYNRNESRPKYTVKYGKFTFHYDTAKELAEMVRDTGAMMSNPYEPGFVEYDIFNDIVSH